MAEVEAKKLATQSLKISASQAILIAGPSGAGKSYIAEQISQLFGFPVISLDHFFLDIERVPEEYLRDGSRAKQWESPAALDLDAISAFLREIIHSGSSLIPQYSFAENRRVGLVPFELPSRSFILEGLNSFFFNGMIRDLGLRSFKLFVDISLAKRDNVIRVRDAEERGKREPFEDRLRVLRLGEKRWVYPQRGDADLVLFRDI